MKNIVSTVLTLPYNISSKNTDNAWVFQQKISNESQHTETKQMSAFTQKARGQHHGNDQGWQEMLKIKDSVEMS